MIRDVIAVFNAMRASGVIEAYAIGGAVAATFYLEPVATVYIDVFVALPGEPGKMILDPRPVFEYLRAAGHSMEGEYFVIGGWPVQILAPGDPLVEEAVKQAAQVDVEGVPAAVFTAEHTAAVALATGRAKDKMRLLQFLTDEAFNMARFEDIVRRHGLGVKWVSFKAAFL